MHYASDLWRLPNYYSHIKTNEPNFVNLARLGKESDFNDLYKYQNKRKEGIKTPKAKAPPPTLLEKHDRGFPWVIRVQGVGNTFEEQMNAFGMAVQRYLERWRGGSISREW